MRIDYELKEIDFIESFVAHRNSNIFSKWLIRVLMAIFALAGVFFALGLISHHSTQDLKRVRPFYKLVFVWVGALWSLPRWNARRQFRKQPKAQGRRSVLLDGSGTHWRWNGGSSEVAWKNYVRSLEGKSQFLLYSSPACFNIIPKRVLTPEGLAELRGLLKQNIPG